uniref:leukotriene B4 receptor 1-like n=1 Tax=Centroberyx gerrardi TaxID=166262 RepID=UPI003AAC44D1
MSISYTSENATGLAVDQRSAVGGPVSSVILGLSFLVGVPGNLLVIWTILRHVTQRSHTVVLILHLAAADLLVLITLPLWIYSLAYSWVFGEASCKAMVYIIKVCMFSSVFFITLMSVERFLFIRYPFEMLAWKDTAIMDTFLGVMWLLAFLLGVPAILTQRVDTIDGTEQCLGMEYSSVAQEMICLCLDTLGGFVAPFTILGICYCLVAAQLKGMHLQHKQKSMVLISSVVIAFTLCWLPYHIINIIDLVCILTRDTNDGARCAPESLIFISGALTFISSSVNPVLYALIAKNFQGSLQETRLVRLFQEVATHTNKLREQVVQYQIGKRATKPQTEQMSDIV